MLNSKITKIGAVVLLLALSNLMFGCGTDNSERPTEPASVEAAAVASDAQVETGAKLMDVGGRQVNLEKAYYSESGDTVYTEMRYRNDAGVWEDRVIVISECDQGTAGGEIAIVPVESKDDPLFGFYVWIDSSDLNTIHMREWTATDYMEITKSVNGDEITETYECNGEFMTISFTEWEFEAYEYCNANQIAMSDDTDPLPENDPIANYRGVDVAKFDAARSFFVENSLYNNIDGDILVGVISDMDFQEWMGSELGVTTSDFKDLDPDVQRMCDIAGGATTKCLLGGVSNPFCVAAVGVTVGCAIANVLDWIFN